MNFRRLWNGIFDRNRAEIIVMHFTGHSLSVHQFVTLRGILTLSHIVSQARLRQWNMQLTRLWNGMFGRVGGQYTINTLPMKNKNLNLIQHGTQITGLGYRIGKCSLNSQHAIVYRHPANVDWSNIRYTNNDDNNYLTERHQYKKKERGKKTKMYFIIILRAILLKDDIANNDRNLDSIRCI